jgi:phosphatidylglycerophosphatase A
MTVPAPLLARWLASWFGCGHFPVAPGTAGSIATLPLHYGLRALGPVPHAAATLVLVLAGTWAAQRVANAQDDEDPSSVVIDEVAGTLIAMGLAAPGGLVAELAALALFRVLDITKPGPIDRAQALRPPGVGIMADDVLAGLGAGAVVRALWQLFAR